MRDSNNDPAELDVLKQLLMAYRYGADYAKEDFFDNQEISGQFVKDYQVEVAHYIVNFLNRLEDPYLFRQAYALLRENIATEDYLFHQLNAVTATTIIPLVIQNSGIFNRPNPSNEISHKALVDFDSPEPEAIVPASRGADNL